MKNKSKQYKLTIPGLLPGLNEYIEAKRATKGKYKAAAMKKQAENVIGYMVKTQLFGVHFERSVIIRYLWVEPNRRRDKDNIAFAKKFVQDSLVSCGVLNIEQRRMESNRVFHRQLRRGSEESAG